MAITAVLDTNILLAAKKLYSKRNSDLINSIIKDHILITGKELVDVIP